MSKRIYNITDKLMTERPVVIIDNEEFEIDDSLVATSKSLEVMADFKMPDGIFEVLKIHLGEVVADKLKSYGRSLEYYQVVFYAVVAAAQGVEYDEIASRFQKSAEQHPVL
ncbi:hypothetical protein SAMN04515656_10345 [Eubacterium aggregans]|uniref:Uncharacterized protein n=1 Tax=Eubacterium aggregans TaxID=81409 RepID=A0A1H3Y5E4_9FIRM|nr:hypothetical protein [Eubacterium aggregans]SEA06068.1 hypothetical protein SAMN04515656_10345 [Eubacterium aggregans]